MIKWANIYINGPVRSSLLLHGIRLKIITLPRICDLHVWIKMQAYWKAMEFKQFLRSNVRLKVSWNKNNGKSYWLLVSDSYQKLLFWMNRMLCVFKITFLMQKALSKQIVYSNNRAKHLIALYIIINWATKHLINQSKCNQNRLTT